MAAVLAVLEAYAVLEQVNNIFAAARDRIDKASNNPNLAKSLASLFQRLQTELAPLADQCKNNSLQLSDHDLDFFTVRIAQLNESMQEIRQTLEEKTKRLKNPVYRFARALTTSGWLSELETTARRADQLLLDIKPFFITANFIQRCIATQGEQQDVFHPSFDVPENPSHVVLNIQSISEMERDDASPRSLESQLKWAVLQSDGSQSIGAVGSRSANSVGVEGMSGVGKSCAMRGLAKDAEVLQRFQQGIYFTILGKDATEADVVQQVANLLSTSGGTRLAREVSGETSVSTAISKAKNWFTEKRCLLLIDDVWEESGTGRDIVARLSRLVDVEMGSRAVFTTRDVRMALRSDAIRFSARDEKVSLQILLSSARLEETDIDSCRVSVEKVLKLCGGIPMALAVAGSAIRGELVAGNSGNGPTVSEALEEHLLGLQKHRSRLVRGTVDNDGYNELELAFTASLSMLDAKKRARLPFVCTRYIAEMYRELVVIRRQGWLSVSILVGLWEMKDEQEAAEVMKTLVEANLALREYRLLNGRKMFGIMLHDLHLDFVIEECKKHGELEKWHRKLLNSFLPEEASSSGQASGNSRSWCGDDVFRDEYIRNNACRHMMCACLEGEIHCLLGNPEWAAKKLRSREALALEEDYGLVLERLLRKRKKNGVELRTGSDEWSLKIIAGAAKLSATYVSANPTEVWFQLYARLRQLSKRSVMIEKYLADIEKYAERPWVKALSACLPEPGGALQSTTLCDGAVRWISVGGGGRLFVCGVDYNGPAFVSTVIEGEVEKTVFVSRGEEGSRSSADVGSLSESEKGVCSSAEGQSSSDAVERSSNSGKRTSEDSSDGDVCTAGSTIFGDNISAACCNRDGTRAVIGYRDGSVQLWNAETGEVIGNGLGRHEDEVKCVAWSADGKLVASGSEDMTVRIWDGKTGESVGGARRGHHGGVRCVAWSEDGKRLASGSRDGTVRVWSMETGEAVLELEISCDESSDRALMVLCLAWSADGKRLASGSDDGMVRVWNAETGEVVSKAMRGHHNGVSCVALSSDGKQVVSGSWDGTLRVCDPGTGEAVGNALRGHSLPVSCVAWSEDGKRVFSGSADETVRVWDVEIDGVEDVPMTGHNDCITCVAFSEDGKRLVSGSDDGIVRIWDTNTAEAIGDALRGHNRWVEWVLWYVDGKRVASASLDGTARLWDAVTGECLKVEDRGSDDVSQLRSLLGDEDMVSEDREEEKDDGDELIDTSMGETVRYLPAGSESVLATLEDSAPWAYSKVSRKIAAGRSNGTVDFFELVV